MRAKKINKGERSLKKVHRDKNKEKREKEVEYEEQDISVSSRMEEEIPEEMIQNYESPEDVKLKIAKKIIEKAQMSVKKHKEKEGDDFFLADQEQRKFEDEGQVAEELKNQYLKQKNKLYVDHTQHYGNIDISQSISYKGHTLCITGISLTDQNIFSCSKDKSIIKWDRQTKKKDFITLGKQSFDHSGPIICLDYHPFFNLLATAGEDGQVKLWDTRSSKLVQTFKGHRSCVNGVKFGLNSPNLCSISSDKTLKQWDCSQRGLIQTFYGHNYEGLDIDCFNKTDFVTSGIDQQTIVWKTQKETQIIFEGHEYAIDRVRTINDEKFVTAGQDGSIYLWSQRKKKSLHKHRNAHDTWIGAMDTLKQTNILATGDCNRMIKLWGIAGQMKGLNLLKTIETKGIVTDLKIREDCIVCTSCDEHRLGRWIKTKCRNQIQIFSFKNNS